MRETDQWTFSLLVLSEFCAHQYQYICNFRVSPTKHCEIYLHVTMLYKY